MAVNKARLLSSMSSLMPHFKRSPFRFFIRSSGFELVGILTKIEYKYDSAWGIMRPWAVVYTVDGQKIEEPLDRKNKRTGRQENLVQAQNDMLVVTARKTTNPDDEDDNNFLYLLNPHQANHIKDLQDRIHERDLVISELEKRYDALEKEKQRLAENVEIFSSTINTLRQKIATLSDQLVQSEAKAEYYETLLRKNRIAILEEEGKIDKALETARKRGAIQVTDTSDIILDAAKKQAEIRMEMDKLGYGEKEYVTKQDLQTMLDELKREIKQASPPEKPSSEEKE